MTRANEKKLQIITAVSAVLLVVLLAIAGLFGNDGWYSANKSLLDGGGATDYTVTLDGNGWSEFTYENAPDFVKAEFLSRNTYSYTLETTAAEQYSMTASITSPKLDVYKRAYTLGFYYFTRQRETTPNVISVQTSADGKIFSEMKNLKCFDNGSDTDTWDYAEVTLESGMKYLRFEFTVYYTMTDTPLVGGGIYLDMDNLTLTSTETTDFSGVDFAVTLGEQELFYNGSEQIPQFEVNADTSEAYYVKTRCEQDGITAISQNAGNYTLCVDVYNNANRLCKTLKKAYTIKPQELVDVEYSFVSNGTYAVLLDAEFTDAAGRKVTLAETGIKTVFDATASVTITVPEGNFTAFSKSVGEVQSDAETPYIYYVTKRNKTTVYDGTRQDVNDIIKCFYSYDFDNDVYAYNVAAMSVEYMQNGETATPIDAGEYEYVIEYGKSKFSGKLTIVPKEIISAEYTGTKNLDKIYDGTKAVCCDGTLCKKLSVDDIVLNDVINEDDVTFDYVETVYARTTGKTYLCFNGGILGGNDATNYVLSDDFYANANAKISPTTLIWTDVADSNGDNLLVSDKVYNGNKEVVIANDTDGCLTMLGLGEGKVGYADVTGTLAYPDCGEQNVNFTLSNASMYDKYTEGIIMNITVKCTVTPCSIQAEAAIFEGEEKEYDGTTSSTVIITELNFASLPNYSDGLAEIVALSANYSVKYENATYDGVNIGNRTITANGITLSGYTNAYDKVLANYYIERVEMSGSIIPRSINVLTENIRIYEGEALPDISTTEGESDIIGTTIHEVLSDAEAGINAISNSRISSGTYFVRVTCVSGNYQIEGAEYVVIPLTVTAINVKAEQKIIFSGIDLVSEKINMFVGGKYALSASSVTEVGGALRATGLSLNYASTGTAGTVSDNGVIEALASGDFYVTVSQRGNDNYNAAQSVIINVHVSDYLIHTRLSGFDDTLYAGDALPNIAAYANYSVNGLPINGTAVADATLLSAGTHSYEYVFTSSSYYETYEFDFTVRGNKYESTAEGYVLTADTEYVDDKTYYNVAFSAATVTAGEAVTPDTYYEYVSGAYVLTEDTAFDGEKNYYTATAIEDKTRKMLEGIYEYDGTNYTITTDDTFVSEKNYYFITQYCFGEYKTNVELSAVKKTLSVIFGGTARIGYSESYDLRNSISEIRLNDNIVKFSDYIGLFNEDAFIVRLITNNEGTIFGQEVSFNGLAVNTYQLLTSGEADGTYVISFDSEEFNYKVALSGSVLLQVEKSAIVVYIENFEKYYLGDMQEEETLRSALKIKGSVAETDVENLLAATSISVSATNSSFVGDYNLVLSGVTDYENYTVRYENGYLRIKPTKVLVYASSRGHVYGNDTGVINVAAAVIDGISFSEEEIAAIQADVMANTDTSVNVTATSNVGLYPISFTYTGDVGNYEIVFDDSYYEISAANFTNIYYNDVTVLYDGKRHYLTVSYDKEQWPDATVTYNNDYFIDAGVYAFTAVVSQENYKNLTLEATLTIGILKLISSNLTVNYTELEVLDSTCKNGVNPNYSLTLIKNEINESRTALVKNATDMEAYEILNAYSVKIYNQTEEVALGYNSYSIKLKPQDITYSEQLKLFGYENGEYKELTYTYKDGIYTANVSSLDDLIFVLEQKKEVNKVFIWLGVAAFAIILLCIFSIFANTNKRGRKEHRRSRRRHHRWA